LREITEPRLDPTIAAILTGTNMDAGVDPGVAAATCAEALVTLVGRASG
jgi:hypothetical protein